MSPRLRLPTPAELPPDVRPLNQGARRNGEIGSVSRAVLFLRIFLFAAAVPVLMRLKIARVAAILEPGEEPRAVDAEYVKRVVAYIETAIRRGRPLIRPVCLTRGLARYYFLRRAGLDLSLRFGISRDDKQGKGRIGHCWLVRDGLPYLEREDPRPRYVEMYHISRETVGKPPAPKGVNAKHVIGT